MFAERDGSTDFEAFDAMADAAAKFARGLEDVGDASEYAKAKSHEAFQAIGDMAQAQIGTIAAGAFNAYADAIDTAISTGEFSARSFGAALRNMLSQTLRSLGQEAAVKGAMQIAEGVAMLANPATSWMAPGHFAAAGQYFAVAALAGVGAGAVSTGGPGRQVPRGKSEDPTNGREAVDDVTVIGVLDTADAELLNEQLATARQSRDL